MSAVNGSTLPKHLVVPLDESRDSQRAVPIAIRFAERLGASVELFAVTNAARSAPVREQLVNVAHQASGPVEGVAVVEGDDVPFEIGRRTRSRAGSMIVMSGDGPRRSSGVLTHSLTAELLADGLPVTLVGPHAVAGPGDLPVVACVDGSAESEQVLPLAASWAVALGVPLDLVVVARPRLIQVPDTTVTRESDDAGDVLTRAADIVSSASPTLDVRRHMATYPWGIADALSLYLEGHPAQLVAAATHVRTGWGRLMAPSTTSRLVRQVSAPMLIVPISRGSGDEHEEAHESDDRFDGGLRCFDEIIVPISSDDLRVDAVVATASALADAGGSAALTFVTCDGADAKLALHERQRTELTELLQPADVRWRIVGSNDVADTVLAAAEAAPKSIVCMASQAPGRVVDTLMPTVSGQIVRWSRRPVVLVGPACEVPSIPYSEIVAFVDGSLVSEAVADLAGSWARVFDSRLRIVEVYHPETTLEGSPPLASRYVDRLAARTARRHKVVAEGIAVAGADAARAILAWSDTRPDALLVMASHGAGLSDHVLGGVVMDVVRHVHSPVVVIPAHAVTQSLPPHEAVHRPEEETSNVAPARDEARLTQRSPGGLP